MCAYPDVLVHVQGTHGINHASLDIHVPMHMPTCVTQPG